MQKIKAKKVRAASSKDTWAGKCGDREEWKNGTEMDEEDGSINYAMKYTNKSNMLQTYCSVHLI